MFGENPVQQYALCGALFEVQKEGKTFCVKKPKYKSTALTLQNLYYCPLDIPCLINYEEYHRAQYAFIYKKVMHGPLKYEDAIRCLYDLLTKLKAVCLLLAQNFVKHNEVRVPNIIFVLTTSMR